MLMVQFVVPGEYIDIGGLYVNITKLIFLKYQIPFASKSYYVRPYLQIEFDNKVMSLLPLC